MARGPLSAQEAEQYKSNGYVLVKALFSEQEINLLRRTAKADKALNDHSYGRADGEGGIIKLSLWNHPGEGIYGMIARCRTLVESAELLLGGEVYHYHSKMIMKEPREGGAWAWHQDYGYWYAHGVLFPALTSVFIAVDRSTKENGCLQVLKGSHLAGRIDHVRTGDQAGADMERVEELAKRLELVYVEMAPGDGVFFDANLVHRSDQNRSDSARWCMICCYNAARNDPYKEGPHPRYTPLSKVDDSMILDVGAQRFDASAAEAMMWHDAGTRAR
ncbi:MAG: phytanoyl-CoA dioxygenase family protein [Acidobacteriaceae bacterium]|nr:phytanoyl-CoA dioxygenase family protein [Acidobacteriaceae bacterium]